MSAGMTVENSVPKNGTIAATPAKTPKARKYGTPSSQSPSVVSAARSTMATIWPSTQARSVMPRSWRMARASGRCGGGVSATIPST